MASSRFSDHFRFSLGAHDGRKSIKRCRGESRESHFHVERHVHRTVRVMVWGAFAQAIRSS